MITIFQNIGYFLRANPSIFIIIGVWDAVWRGMALWKSARNNQRYWFIALMVVNSIGILPIVYLRFFQKTAIKKKHAV